MTTDESNGYQKVVCLICTATTGEIKMKNWTLTQKRDCSTHIAKNAAVTDPPALKEISYDSASTTLTENLSTYFDFLYADDDAIDCGRVTCAVYDGSDGLCATALTTNPASLVTINVDTSSTNGPNTN